MYNEKDLNEFIQWKKDTELVKHELIDIFVNDNGQIKTEKKMAQIVKTTPEDWKEFCKVTGREYDGKMYIKC